MNLCSQNCSKTCHERHYNHEYILVDEESTKKKECSGQLHTTAFWISKFLWRWMSPVFPILQPRNWNPFAGAEDSESELARKPCEVFRLRLHVLQVNNLYLFVLEIGKEGLCILLRRLSYPNRLCDLVPMFKRDEGTISRIVNFMLKLIYNGYAKRLNSLKQNYLTPEALQELADVS